MNQYTIDGVPLLDPERRWFTDTETGVRVVPSRRVPKYTFPGVSGEAQLALAPWSAGSVFISLRIRGKDYAEMRVNYEKIMGVITQSHKLLTLREHMGPEPDDLVDRVALVTLASSAEPVMTSASSCIVQFILSIPGVFWQSVREHTDTSVTSIPNTGGVGAEYTLKGFEGGNAPIHDSLIRIRGGKMDGLYLEDLVSGINVGVTTGMAANETIIIDTANWKAIKTTSTADTWSLNQGTDISAKINPGHGYGSMFSMYPENDPATLTMRYRVRVKATNTSGKPVIAFKAKKSYL